MSVWLLWPKKLSWTKVRWWCKRDDHDKICKRFGECIQWQLVTAGAIVLNNLNTTSLVPA